MKVSELIEWLKNQDQELIVQVNCSKGASSQYLIFKPELHVQEHWGFLLLGSNE